MIKNKALSSLESLCQIGAILFCLLCLHSCSSYKTYTTDVNKNAAPVKIGVLLPMSKNAEESKAIAEMIRLGVKEALRAQIDIHFYDISTPKAMKSSLKRITASGTKIVIGPITSQNTQKIAAYLQGRDIDLITLSNDPSLAGPNIYVFGHQPLKQTEQLVEGFLRKGHSQYITLVPNNSYHRSINNIVTNEILSRNSTIAGEYFYDIDPESIAHNTESVSKLVDLLNENPDNEKKVVIYVAGGGQSLHLLYNSILAHNLDKKAIITGNNKVDIDYPGNIRLYVTGSNNLMTSNLSDKAEILLGRRYLNFLEILAYDAGYIVATALQHEYNPEGFRARLSSRDGFVGLAGITYLSSHIAERNYHLLKKENGKYYQLFKSQKATQ